MLLVVGEPPAGGDGPALRDFCAATMASGYFRLPQFGYALLTALQCEEVLNNEVPEFRGITFTLDCADETPLFAQVGDPEHLATATRAPPDNLRMTSPVPPEYLPIPLTSTLTRHRSSRAEGLRGAPTA